MSITKIGLYLSALKECGSNIGECWLRKNGIDEYQMIETLIAALEAQEWVPVSEGPPEDTKQCLALNSDKLMFRASHAEQGWWDEEIQNEYIETNQPITHWRYMPEPPEEDAP